MLIEYWERAEEIISEFNDYGGGPEHLEYEAYEYLEKMREVWSECSVSTEEKHLLIKEIFAQYAIGNSGFDDVLCESESDWRHVITLLQKQPSAWNQTLMMRIYKNQLQDGEAYLALRLQSLKFGMDYWDLATYYLSQSQINQAVEIAEAGIENGKGRQTELFAFLFDYYAEQEKLNQLQALIERAFLKQSDIELIRDRAFIYFKQKNNYEEGKNVLIRAFRTDYHGKNHAEDFYFMKE
ncbi:hypothetical protein ACO11K_004049 [Bacillus cytotoxicus]|uniref:hypothetical protein n=1 Tax=Bacillus cereus group sp. BfR-BA-01492 TaxID=2920361 RepID=UPI001F5A5F56|nr:hypothetical protein [Bacillus cereus group sp. BfR-BA-01492]